MNKPFMSLYFYSFGVKSTSYKLCSNWTFSDLNINVIISVYVLKDNELIMSFPSSYIPYCLNIVDFISFMFTLTLVKIISDTYYK